MFIPKKSLTNTHGGRTGSAAAVEHQKKETFTRGAPKQLGEKVNLSELHSPHLQVGFIAPRYSGKPLCQSQELLRQAAPGPA